MIEYALAQLSDQVVILNEKIKKLLENNKSG
jgi:hypothetical protein